MHHIAILSKSWHLLDKIASGGKTIESRWYKFRYPPWDKVRPSDTLWFKDSGEPVVLKARVTKVLQFENLDESKIKKIREKYARRLGLSKKQVSMIRDYFQGKKYCILIFFDNVKRVRPFKIDKRGFGSAAAWLVVDNIEKVRI